jgi:hypothetical protein
MVKLKEEYLKNKLKDKFGELEVYNPIDRNIYNKLTKMIRDNSEAVMINDILETYSDVEINNTVCIMREMLKLLTNIDEDWDLKTDEELDDLLNRANGDFKKVIYSLVDIMLEIAQDNRMENIRKIDTLNKKLIEVKKSLKTGIGLQQTLSEFGLDINKLTELNNGNNEILKEVQEHIIKDIEKGLKPKRQYNKKKK